MKQSSQLHAQECCSKEFESQINLRFNKIDINLTKIEHLLSEIHADIKKQNSAAHDYIPQTCSDEELRSICKNAPHIVAELANLEAPQLQESAKNAPKIDN